MNRSIACRTMPQALDLAETLNFVATATVDTDSKGRPVVLTDASEATLDEAIALIADGDECPRWRAWLAPSTERPWEK